MTGLFLEQPSAVAPRTSDAARSGSKTPNRWHDEQIVRNQPDFGECGILVAEQIQLTSIRGLSVEIY